MKMEMKHENEIIWIVDVCCSLLIIMLLTAE